MHFSEKDEIKRVRRAAVWLCVALGCYSSTGIAVLCLDALGSPAVNVVRVAYTLSAVWVLAFVGCIAIVSLRGGDAWGWSRLLYAAAKRHAAAHQGASVRYSDGVSVTVSYVIDPSYAEPVLYVYMQTLAGHARRIKLQADANGDIMLEGCDDIRRITTFMRRLTRALYNPSIPSRLTCWA